MALLKAYYNKQYEITIPNCYWKVANNNGISGGKTQLSVLLLCYKTHEAANTNSSEYGGFGFQFVPNLVSAENFLAQAYTYAKTLPEFTGAIDA
jgi:2-hydroxychromene-2-carboxylate isomerase